MMHLHWVGLLASLLLGPSDFEGYSRQELPTGPLLWSGWHEADREAIASRLPRELQRVESALGRPVGGPFTTVLTPDGFVLADHVQRLVAERVSPERARGVAIPSRRLLLVRADPLAGLEDLTATLRHEISHLVLHERRPGSLPRWLDEGIACWVSGRRVRPEDLARLALLARVNGLYSWASLEREFPDGEDTSSVAYTQSWLFLRFLAERHGEAIVPRLLGRLDAGLAVESALEEATGEGGAALQRAFRGWVARQASLLTAVFVGGPGFWCLGGLLALLAIGRYWLRRRRFFAREALSEATGPPMSISKSVLAPTSESPHPPEPSRAPESTDVRV